MKKFIYPELAQKTKDFVMNLSIKMNLFFLSCLKFLPICFAAIWYNDEKSPNYLGVIFLLFWYSYLNQLMTVWKKNSNCSLNEQYFQCFVQILTRWGLARFISETLELYYFRESMLIIVAALIVPFFQFLLVNQFKSKNKFVRFMECQCKKNFYLGVLLIQIFLLFLYMAQKISIAYFVSNILINLLGVVHFLWLIRLVYQIFINTKSLWNIKQQRKNRINQLCMFFIIFYPILFLQVLQIHMHSGVGFRLYMQIITAIITASYLSKRIIQTKSQSIRLSTITLNSIVYFVVVISFLIYYFYNRTMTGEQQHNQFFWYLTRLFIFTILCMIKEFLDIGKILIKMQQRRIFDKP